MMVSGMLFSLSEPLINSLTDYVKFIIKKFKRLLVPYFVISCIILCLKAIAGFYFDLTHPIDNNVLYYLFLNPMAKLTPDGGFATFLWFIYTIFIIFLIIPILFSLGKNVFLLFVISLLLSLISWPKIFCLNLAFRFLPIFIFGYLFIKNEFLFAINKKHGFFFFLFSFLFFFFFEDIFQISININLLRVLRGLSGALMSYFAAGLIVEKKKVKSVYNMIHMLGVYSSVIYLLHIICMGPLTIFFYQVMQVGISSFIVIAPIIWTIGLYLPMFIDKFFIQPNQLASKLILGR